MPHIEQQRGVTAAAEAEAEFQQVRESFLGRLNTEHLRLHTLRDALQSVAVDPAAVFRELQYFAHRLRGAAAVFNIPEVRDSSKTLELAASEAEGRQGCRGDSLVLDAIRALEMRLLVITGGKAPAALAVKS